jgi:transcriptional repressor NrdR
MYCSKCGSLEDKVIDSRLAKDGRSIRRRRECIACNHRYTTYEEIERADLRVVKRDGRSEPFDRHKLQTGMVKACEKRPVSIETIELAAEKIIRDIEADFPKEIPSHVRMSATRAFTGIFRTSGNLSTKSRHSKSARERARCNRSFLNDRAAR